MKLISVIHEMCELQGKQYIFVYQILASILTSTSLQMPHEREIYVYK